MAAWVLADANLFRLLTLYQDGVYSALLPLVAQLNWSPPLPTLLRTKAPVVIEMVERLVASCHGLHSELTNRRLVQCAPHLHSFLCVHAACSGQLQVLMSLLEVQVCHQVIGLCLDVAVICNHRRVVEVLSPLTQSSNALVFAACKGFADLVPLVKNHGHLLQAQAGAAANGHLDIVCHLHQLRSMSEEKIVWPIYPLDKAAINGHRLVLRYLSSEGYRGTTEAMDMAATNGHYDVVSFLHFQRTEGCTTKAIDGAAAYGHLDVVQFLLDHRNEGCTPLAVRGASANGHLEIVKLLCASTYQSPQALSDAVDYAAAFGHFNVLSWLLQEKAANFSPAAITEAARCNNHDIVRILLQKCAKVTELALIAAGAKGHLDMFLQLHAAASHLPVDRAFIKAASEGQLCILEVILPMLSEPSSTLTASLVEAASNGHASVVQMLLFQNERRLPADAMDSAASKGHLTILQALHNAGGVCTTKALDGAARNGHLKVVQFLLNHRQEGGTLSAWSGAACRGHLHVLIYLHHHLFPMGGSYDALVLAARMGHFKIVRYLIENDRDHAVRIGSAITEAKIQGHQSTLAYLLQVAARLS